MKMSESIENISKALSSAWKSIKNPKHNQNVTVKTRKGGTYDFQYTDLTGIFDEVKPHLSENGITILQQAYTEVANGGLLVSVTTRLVHTSGEWIESKPMQFPLGENDIQSMGGLVTYMKRYSLSAMLGISTEADDDGNMASGNTATFKATDKQLNYVTSLINNKYKKREDRIAHFNDMIGKLKLNKDMTTWTSQDASKAIKHLQSDANA